MGQMVGSKHVGDATDFSFQVQQCFGSHPIESKSTIVLTIRDSKNSEYSTLDESGAALLFLGKVLKGSMAGVEGAWHIASPPWGAIRESHGTAIFSGPTDFPYTRYPGMMTIPELYKALSIDLKKCDRKSLKIRDRKRELGTYD